MTVICCHSSTAEHYRHMAEDAAQDLLAEAVYNDPTVPIVDAFDLFGEPAFDHCDKQRHYAVGGAANGASVAWDALTPYHEVGACPNAGETVDGAWEACESTYPRDDF